MLLSPSNLTLQLRHYSVVRFYLAYSGGVDSHVLLHLCASTVALKSKITAVYVHHGLQIEADAWAEHCKQTTVALGVDFQVLRVNALPLQGESPEEAARNARYNALKALIQPDCALLVAQHKEDQLETVLLQLFRGGGLRGLSGMPECMVFGEGIMLRPLLSYTKHSINTYAQTHGLQFVNDPSNYCSDYDRNFLRNQIVPLLKQRWPALDKTISRSAQHCAQAEQLIIQTTQQWFLSVFNHADQTLMLKQLMLFNSPCQSHIIRAWLRYLGYKMPSYAFVGRVLTEVMLARPDRMPILAGQGYTVRRYRDKLYCLKQTEKQVLQEIVWPKASASITVPGLGVLTCESTKKGICAKSWQRATVVVKFRDGGEKICLPFRAGAHALKKLFQEAGIPPWKRETIPLIYLDNTLAAVGDKWISAAFYTETQDAVHLVLIPPQ